jgi:hypothetical protein
MSLGAQHAQSFVCSSSQNMQQHVTVKYAYTSDKINIINPLKTNRICFIQGLSAYRAVNTLHFGYKNQSLNVL